jgi:phosphonate transport system ATP-binding protein
MPRLISAPPALEALHLVSAVSDPLGRPLLNDISFQIQGGEFVALLGLNGAGKSTLLRTCLGLLPLHQGAVKIQGQLLTPGSGDRLRRQVNLIPQGGGLVGQLSALDNVLCGQLGSLSSWQTLWGFPSGDRQRGMELLAQLGLADQAQQRTQSLSGGQRQRVAIARALMQPGQILLADEPTAGLDVIASEQVMQILASLQRQRGMTVIVVVHDLEIAQTFAQRALVLDRGELVYEGRCHHLASQFSQLGSQLGSRLDPELNQPRLSA